MLVEFGTNDKPFNSTSNTYQVKQTADCILKETTSLINPTLIVSDKEVAQTPLYELNYFHFRGRWYWISDIRHFTNHICEIDGRVDVLGTYKAEILNSQAYVTYCNSDNANHYNALLDNGKIARSGCTQVQTYPGVNLGYIDAENGCFIVSVMCTGAGATGAATLFALDQSEMASFLDTLCAPTLWDQVADFLYNPDEAVLGAIWIPVNKSQIAGSSSAVTFGSYEIFSGATLVGRRTLETSCYVTASLPFIDENGKADYRNCEPYSQWSIWLPFAGQISLPIEPFINAETQNQIALEIIMTMSVATGECVYTLQNYSSASQAGNIITVKGNAGVEVPVGKQSTGLGSGVSGMINAASSLAVALITKNPGLATTMGVSAMASAAQASLATMQSTHQLSGSLGGWSTTGARSSQVQLLRTSYIASDTPENSHRVIGRPLFKRMNLDQLLGTKVWISEFNFATLGSGGTAAPTYDEWQELSRLLTSEQGVFLEA